MIIRLGNRLDRNCVAACVCRNNGISDLDVLGLDFGVGNLDKLLDIFLFFHLATFPLCGVNAAGV